MRKIYRINQFISAAQVRLIGQDNKQIGVVDKFKALEMAREQGLDLVEVASHAQPPVARIIDFKKFKYQEAKKEQAAKKGIKRVETKQIILTPFIAEGDYRTNLNKALKWFAEQNRVKVIVKFVGRQITRKEFGFNLINKFAKDVEEKAKKEGFPKMERKMLWAMFTPITTKKSVPIS